MDDSEIDIGVLGTGMGRASVKELGKRLLRDPFVISRLYSVFAAARDPKLEGLTSTTEIITDVSGVAVGETKKHVELNRIQIPSGVLPIVE
jgi:hypothetical protein